VQRHAQQYPVAAIAISDTLLLLSWPLALLLLGRLHHHDCCWLLTGPASLCASHNRHNGSARNSA
jgi:hypothetical protein